MAAWAAASVSGGDVNIRGFLRSSCVAWGHEDLGDKLTCCNFPREGMFATPAADHQDFHK